MLHESFEKKGVDFLFFDGFLSKKCVLHDACAFIHDQN